MKHVIPVPRFHHLEVLLDSLHLTLHASHLLAREAADFLGPLGLNQISLTCCRQDHLRSSRVLGKDDGEPITRQGAWSRVRYAAHRANVPTGVHILRHTFCSHLVMRGASMRSVQELVGHQDLTMTQRYSHLSPTALIDTVRLLEIRAVDSERGEIRETTEGRDRKLKS